MITATYKGTPINEIHGYRWWRGKRYALITRDLAGVNITIAVYLDDITIRSQP